MKVRMSVGQQDAEAFMDKVIIKYHFNESDRAELQRVYSQMQLVMGPYATYRINQRVTGVAVIDNNQAAVVAMTLGAGVDNLQDKYMRAERLNEAYMLECLSNELLLLMYGEFNEIYARFHRRYVQRYVFIGNEIPVTVIPGLLEDIKGKKNISKPDKKPEQGSDAEEIGELAGWEGAKREACGAEQENRTESGEITANTYGVLIPSKSVVFYAVLSENPNQLCEGICTGCGNPNCENRMYEGIQESKGVMQKGNDIGDDAVNAARKSLNYGFRQIFGG